MGHLIVRQGIRFCSIWYLVEILFAPNFLANSLKALKNMLKVDLTFLGTNDNANKKVIDHAISFIVLTRANQVCFFLCFRAKRKLGDVWAADFGGKWTGK